MRITNQMMTNNSLNNINRNKNRLNTLDQQYSTGKKIQKPSDDPIIAVRALKLRTTVSEIEQYYSKNIPDAMSWMDLTESALTNINSILTNLHTAFDQGANGTYEKGDLEGIAKNMKEMKAQIYQEGNSNYAGRYVFSGYKTNTSLIFNEPSPNMRYVINESFSGEAIDTVTTVVNSYDISDYNSGSTVDDFADAPRTVENYRIRLSYADLDAASAASGNPKVTYKDPVNGNMKTATVNPISIKDPDAYNVGDNEVNFIPETGELILGKNVFNEMRLNQSGDINITYEKTSFEKGDLRPEHYFECTVYDTKADPPDTKGIKYELEDQKIQYEITFNQTLTVNTQGKDAISHSIGREIDELFMAVEDVTITEKKIAEVDKLIENTNTTADQKDVLNKLREQLDTELILKKDILQKKFAGGLTATEEYQKQVSVLVADAGSRYVRLQLTDSRLDTQRVDFKDLMSNNEDADFAEVIINYTSAETIYNASLNAASKIIKNTLLDFI